MSTQEDKTEETIPLIPAIVLALSVIHACATVGYAFDLRSFDTGLASIFLISLGFKLPKFLNFGESQRREKALSMMAYAFVFIAISIFTLLIAF